MDRQMHLSPLLCGPQETGRLFFGGTWALTPARPLQVFGTSSDEHAKAIERVKKAKVGLPRRVGRR